MSASDPQSSPASSSAADSPASEAVGRGRRYLREGDELYVLSQRSHRKVLALAARGERVRLAEWGARIGSAPDITALPTSIPADISPAVKGPRGRKPTTGRFNTRQELLERVWFYAQCTNLSEAAIAHNVQVSPGVVATILRTSEGKPETPTDQADAQGPQ